MQLKADILFDEKPQKWGLRGDPFLWADLKNTFLEVTLPCSKEEFMTKIQENFLKLTGHSLEENNDFYVEKYSKGGMSSGQICVRIWREELIPLLIQRLIKYK